MTPAIDTNPKAADKPYNETYSHMLCPPDSDPARRMYGVVAIDTPNALFKKRNTSRIGIPALLK
jgi:hypothetical protein